MDATTLGAALALMKGMPDTAASSAAAAEAAAGRAEAAAEAAVTYTAQSGKTAAQQAQARANIGAMPIEWTRIPVTTLGSVYSVSADTFIPVDENGDPTITSISGDVGSTIRCHIMSCAPGDMFKIKCNNTANYARSVLCLGATVQNEQSATGYSRPVLLMYSSTPEIVIVAPDGAEMMIFHSTVGLSSNNTNVYQQSTQIKTTVEDLEAKIAIARGIEVEVEGNTVEINAEEGHRYICTSQVPEYIEFTPQLDGLCELIFPTSSLVPVLDIHANLPEWFIVEPNRRYDIMINNGWATVTSWSVGR